MCEAGHRIDVVIAVVVTVCNVARSVSLSAHVNILVSKGIIIRETVCEIGRQ